MKTRLDNSFARGQPSTQDACVMMNRALKRVRNVKFFLARLRRESVMLAVSAALVGGVSTPVNLRAADGAQAINTAISGAAFAASAYDSTTSSWHFGQCSGERVHHCVLGAMFLAQAGMMLAGGDDAEDRANDFAYIPNMPYPTGPNPNSNTNPNTNLVPTPTPPAPGSGTSPAYKDAQNKYNAAMAQMRDKGWNVKDGKIVGPDGKSIPLGSVSNPSSLAGLGLNADQIEQMQAELKKAEKDKPNVLAIGTEGGGGGGGGKGGGGGGSGAAGPDMDAFMRQLMGKNKSRTPASVVGMNKNFGDDRIGVAGDNIFSMIQRRYSAKYKANHFIKDGVAKPRADSPYKF